MAGQVFPSSSIGVWSDAAESRKNGRRLPVALFFLLSDILALSLTAALAGAGAMMLAPELAGSTAFSTPLTATAAIELAKCLGLAIGVFWLAGLYRRHSWELDEIATVVGAVGVVVLSAWATQPALGFSTAPALPIAIWVLGFGLVISLRMAVRATPIVRSAMSEPLILVGNGMSSAELSAQLKESRSMKSDVLSQYGSAEFLRLLEKAPRVGVAGVAESAGCDPRRVTFALVPSPDEMVDVSDIVDRLAAAEANYMVAVPFFGLARRTVTLRKVMGGDVVFAEVFNRRSTGLAIILKRAIDIAGSLAAIIMLSPILLFITAMLMFERGPVFFKQLRVGKGRTRFDCLKFRSMVPDAEERLIRYLEANPEAKREWETYQKLTNDPRVTWIGRLLRKSSMDELPQLINVLRGEMSLVGPRPIVAPEVKGYDSDHAYFHSEEFNDYARMRPGITGLWQVSGRASTTHDERIRLDRWYARNWSIWLDVVIIFKTIRAAALGTGSS